ncbi:MAG: hypothetical protein WCK28_00125 [Burkholderiales bacterium]|jgi:hypothetical protein
MSDDTQNQNPPPAGETPPAGSTPPAAEAQPPAISDAEAIAAAHAAAEAAAAAAAAAQDPKTFATLKVPEGATQCSWGGETFKADKKGRVKVPQAAVADLLDHGFITVSE